MQYTCKCTEHLLQKKKNATPIPKLAYEYIPIGRKKSRSSGKIWRNQDPSTRKKHRMAYTLLLFMKTLILATRYGLEGPGIESRWGRGDLPHLSRPALGPTQPPIQCYRVSFQAVKRPGRGVDHPSPSSAEVKESVELYLYFPSGSSWPITG